MSPGIDNIKLNASPYLDGRVPFLQAGLDGLRAPRLGGDGVHGHSLLMQLLRDLIDLAQLEG